MFWLCSLFNYPAKQHRIFCWDGGMVGRGGGGGKRQGKEGGGKVGVRSVYIKSINRKMMSGQVVSGSCGVKRSRKKRNRYAKISLKAKLIFFRKVIHENGNLRDIARRLGIKYSTAKTLTRNYRSIPQEQNTPLVNALCEQFDKKSRARRRCSYRVIEDHSSTSEQCLKLEEPWRDGWPPQRKIEIICNSIAQQ